MPFQFTFIEWLSQQFPHHLQVYLLPYSQSNMTWFVQFIDITGMWGITFWLMVMNVIITNLLLSYKEKKSFTIEEGLGAVLCLFFPLLYSLWVIKIQPKNVLGNLNKKTKVSIIQTNIDAYAKGDSTISQKIFDEVISLSDSAVRTAKPDLIVLPETAIPIPLFQDKNLLDFTKKAIASWQTSVAIGFVESPDSTKLQNFKNNALVFTPQLAMFWDSLKIKPTDVKVYQKEYGLPFMELMPYIPDYPSLAGSTMLRGNEPYTFSYSNFNNDKFNVGLTICWEQMYPNKIAELVDSGAEFIALMNNDAWFGTTPGAKQLVSFTRLRAIENRRSIVRCSNGGISCFIDPFGNVSGKLPWFTSTIGTKEILCVQKKTFYTKHPNWFPTLCAIIFIFLASFILWRKPKNIML